MSVKDKPKRTPHNSMAMKNEIGINEVGIFIVCQTNIWRYTEKGKTKSDSDTYVVL